MTHQPRLLVRGPTIDFDPRGPSPEYDKDAEQVMFIRHDSRTASPTGEYLPNPVSPSRSKEFARVRKGDIEMMQLLSSGTGTASILSDKGLKIPTTDSGGPSTYRRSERSAAKTMRQPRDQGETDDVDTVTLIQDLVSLSKNSPSGASPLHYAQTCSKFPSIVSEMLIDQLGIDINVIDNDGDTPLHWAVTHSHLESIECLVSRGANEAICNKSEEAPIHLAIKGGLIDATRIMFGLKCSSHILYSYRGRNYLHLACEQNNIEMVRLILTFCPKGRAGDDFLDLPVPLVTLVDHDNLTPIHTAAKKCDYQILDLLLHQLEGADQKESTLLSESREGFTPLHYSVDAGNLNNVRLLLKHGASPLTASRQQQISSVHLAAIRWSSSSQNEILTELLMWAKAIDPTAVDIRDSLDRSPLHYAATYDHAHSATVLHSYGANLDSIDRDGSTPLIVAASKGANRVLKLLLSKGADVTAQNHKGKTALVVAIEEGHWKTSRELLAIPDAESKSLLVLIPDDNGLSPLHVLCKASGDYKTIVMLLELHADVNMHDKNRRIPLHYACHFGSYPMGYKLLQEGVWGSMLNEVDCKGYTSLHMAARKGHYDLVKLLIQKGAHTTKSLNHDSAFSLACKDGHLKCAQILYKSNDSILNWQNDQGHSALHLSAMNGHKDTVLWLLDIQCLLLFDRNDKSFADIAIERKEQTLMSAVLDHKRWREVMSLSSPAVPPLFVSLVKFLPDLAKVILERAILKSSTPREHEDYYERVDFSFLTSGTSGEDLYRTSSAVSRTWAQRNHGNSNKQRLKRDLISQEAHKHISPFKKRNWMSRFKSHYTLSNLLRSRYVYEDSSLYALHTMIEHYRLGLLTHPVTKTYLDYKWRTYGRIYYTISILPFFIFLMLLTMEVFYVYFHTNDVFQSTGMVARSNSTCSSFLQFNQTMLTEDGYTDANLATTNFFVKTSLQTNVTRIFSEDNLRCICHPVPTLNIVAEKELYIIIPLYFFTFIGLLLQFGRFIKQPILYWFNALNIMELLTILMTLTVREENGINIDRAALALFLGYGAMFLQFKRYSWSGLYVTMFQEVIKSMIKTILVFIPILLAYVIIFFIMVSPSKGFANIVVSIVRIPVMLVGEVDFYDSFLTEAQCYRNKEMVYAVLIIFVFGITISFANLLIGLAVGDIDNILKQAVVSKSIEQVNWLTEFELGPIFPLFKKWIRWDFLMVYPNRKRRLFSKVMAPLDVFGVFSQIYTSHDELNSDITDPNLLFLIGLKEENNNLKMQLEIAADEISNLHTSVTKVFAVVQKLDQKMDALNPEDTQRSLPRASPIDRRLTVNNSQSQSQ